MSAQDLTPQELDGTRYQKVIFDRDDDKLIRMNGGWVYENLVGTWKGPLLKRPQGYGPYSVTPKGVRLNSPKLKGSLS